LLVGEGNLGGSAEEVSPGEKEKKEKRRVWEGGKGNSPEKRGLASL